MYKNANITIKVIRADNEFETLREDIIAPTDLQIHAQLEHVKIDSNSIMVKFKYH